MAKLSNLLQYELNPTNACLTERNDGIKMGRKSAATSCENKKNIFYLCGASQLKV